MGCPTESKIGENLTFSVCTHDPDTGVLTDAAAVPAYRIYEDDTATAILNDDMAKLDDANTTGFYVKKIAVSTANGFEKGKNYTIYIEATVDGDKGGISYAFRVCNDITAVEAMAGSGSITWTYTLTITGFATPIADAHVWVTTDITGLNVVASAYTDAFGIATFYLDAGTYYVFRSKSGYTFTNPDLEIVAP